MWTLTRKVDLKDTILKDFSWSEVLFWQLIRLKFGSVGIVFVFRPVGIYSKEADVKFRKEEKEKWHWAWNIGVADVRLGTLDGLVEYPKDFIYAPRLASQVDTQEASTHPIHLVQHCPLSLRGQKGLSDSLQA